MITNKEFAQRVANIFALVTLLAASVLPAMLLNSTAKATQITERSITLTNSLAGDDDNTATVSFKNATAGTVQGIVVEFCTTALIGTSCTAPTGLDTAGTTASQSIDATTFSVAVATNKVTLTNATGATASAGEAYSFTINLDNPNAVGTFYARILTYAVSATATAYTSTSPGAHIDDGSVALSTTNDITVTGTVTETLTFCVGATDSTPAAGDADIQDCSQSGFSSAKTVGLGIIDSAAVTTPRATADGGTNTNGAFLIKTNAVNGAVIGYRSNLNTSSGKLKIAGATCTDNVSTVDGCINSAGTTANTISGEEFGMAISEMIYPNSKTGSGTTGLVRDGEYDWTSSNTYAWDDTGTFDQIASSTGSTPKVLDYELGVLKFSAISAPTTPSGSYTVSANFVATGTF